MEINFLSSIQIEKDNTIVIGLFENCTIYTRLRSVDISLNGIIANYIENTNFNGEDDESIFTFTTIDNVKINILLVGLGDHNQILPEEIAYKLHHQISRYKIKNPTIVTNLQNHASIIKVAETFLGLEYKMLELKNTDKIEEIFTIEALTIIADDTETLSKHLKAISLPLYNGINHAKRLITLPGNILGPEEFADNILHLFKGTDAKVEILDEKALQKLGMNALLSVGLGSKKPTKLAIIKYCGMDEKDSIPLALVGKGVTFDTGGVSLKPSKKMGDMKYDMAGAAVVMGTMLALAKRNARTNIVAVLPIVENAIGGNASRPGDVVKSMSGKTIEILNTDAEGRLILADAIWYAQEKFNVKTVIDVATLTGAVVVALGNFYAGIFSNNDKLTTKLIESSNETLERLWHLPINKYHAKLLKSPIADIQNIDNSKTGGDATFAAVFLKQFIKEGVEWAHLDIAGVAWDYSLEYYPRGASGFGVKLLHNFIMKNYES